MFWLSMVKKIRKSLWWTKYQNFHRVRLFDSWPCILRWWEESFSIIPWSPAPWLRELKGMHSDLQTGGTTQLLGESRVLLVGLLWTFAFDSTSESISDKRVLRYVLFLLPQLQYGRTWPSAGQVGKEGGDTWKER